MKTCMRSLFISNFSLCDIILFNQETELFRAKLGGIRLSTQRKPFSWILGLLVLFHLLLSGVELSYIMAEMPSFMNPFAEMQVRPHYVSQVRKPVVVILFYTWEKVCRDMMDEGDAAQCITFFSPPASISVLFVLFLCLLHPPICVPVPLNTINKALILGSPNPGDYPASSPPLGATMFCIQSWLL